MSWYLIEETSLANLADAIRDKANITGLLTIDDMISVINNLYVPTDILTVKNLTSWTKNIDFGGTVSYEDTGVNKINIAKDYTGISGYERFYYPVTVAKNTTYCFSVDYCTPTGWLYKDFDNAGMGGEFTYVFASEPTGTWSPNSVVSGANRFGMLGKSSTPLETVASTIYKKYVTVFNSGNYTTVWLTISMGYIEDGVPVDLKFKNLSLYQLK